MVRGVVGVVLVVGGTTRASPFSSWETSVQVSVGEGSLDEGRLRKRGEGVMSHAESPILPVRIEFIL